MRACHRTFEAVNYGGDRGWSERQLSRAAYLLLLCAAPALPAAIDARFVGNQACAPCHADIVRRYSTTPMAMSSGRGSGQVTAGSFRHSTSQVRYDIDSSGLVR